MTPPPIQHALVLNFHQPSGNLDHLLHESPWEVKEILFALDRMPRALWSAADLGRVHLSLSGTLLETLSSPGFQEQVYGTVKVGELLWHLQNTEIFDVLGTGYYHPVLPLVPEADWDEQIGRWRGIGRHLFWRESFSGFWPPEMGFCMEMIPHLVTNGYRYVLVDDIYVEPAEGEEEMSWQELRYRPHVAEHGGAEIVVVVRDRDLSNAQLSGMQPDWFLYEVQERTKGCDFTPLVTTCSDGDNGGWFRNTSPEANFWHAFYRPFLNKVRAGEAGVQPTFIHDYLDRFGTGGRVHVKTGAWNTEDHYGDDFTQWTGTDEQKGALARVKVVSADWQAAAERAEGRGHPLRERALGHLQEVRWRILRAETSCNVYWAEAWTHKVHEDLDVAERLLKEVPGEG